MTGPKPVTVNLAIEGVTNRLSHHGIVSTTTHEIPQRERASRGETLPQGAHGGNTNTITGRAEVIAHRGDETDRRPQGGLGVYAFRPSLPVTRWTTVTGRAVLVRA